VSSLRFHTTRHSANRASERNLSFQDLKNVVNYSGFKTKVRTRRAVDGFFANQSMEEHR
jgi:hypothetical protein